MEKIKSVLSGHRKSQDATHDAHASSTGAPAGKHATGAPTDSQTHPIFDEMTHGEAQGTSSAQPITSGMPPSAGQTATTTGTGQAALHGIDGPQASTGAVSGGSVRPGVSSDLQSEISGASIKSGVIGFGADAHQGHAALPSRNPVEDRLGSKQILGGGNTTRNPKTGTTSEIQSQALPHSSTAPHDRSDAAKQQPFERTLRQESYTADTDRSFPLAGGVTSTQTTNQTSLAHHPVTSEREPGTKEKDVGVRDGQGRESLAGAAAAASAAGVAAPLMHSEQKNVSTQDTPHTTRSSQPLASSTTAPTTKHNPEALAAATAAAAKYSDNSSNPQETGIKSQANALPTGALSGLRPSGGRSESWVHVPGEFPTPTPDESKTYLFYRDGLVSAPGAETPLSPGHHGAHDQQHMSKVSNVTSQNTANTAATAPLASTAATDDLAGQQELRHTGSLDQPRPKSSDLSDEHHYGRDAAIAGGVGAGAAGLGYAATHKHHDSGVGGNVGDEANPYSSKAIDPRVMGGRSQLEEQRFDPQVKTQAPPHHDQQSSAAVIPPTEDKHHYGRDAALVGAGAATAGTAHSALQRNDTAGTGTAVLPQGSSTQPATQQATPHPLSQELTNTSTTSTSQPQSQASIPPGVDTKAYTGPKTVDGSPFYGAVGAPAPVVGDKSLPTQPTSTIGDTTNQQKDQHHYGRDATLVGAGAATAGGLAYAGHHDNKTDTGPASSTIGPHSSNAANVLDPRVQPDPSKQVHHNVGPTAEDPASKTIGPHKSNIANILDPRVQPDPAKQKGHTTEGPHQSDTLNRADPRVDEKANKDEHHYGRDAALLGGAGATAYGAHEAIDAYGNHRMTQPGAAMTEQRYDPSATGARAPNPVQSSQYDYNNEHTKRNATLGTGAALGAGAVGGAAYEGSKHGGNTNQGLAASNQPLGSSVAPGSATQAHPAQGAVPGAIDSKHDATHDSRDKDHTKRDAALLGGGAAAAGGAAYAHHQQQDTEQLKKDQKAHDKEQHKLEKEQHKHEKELEKHRKDDATPEKRHSILGFLHRDKSKKEKRSSNDSSPRQSGEVGRSHDSPRHSKEYAAAGGALAAGGVAAAAHDSDPDSPRWKGKNRLHKNPPPGHPAHEAMTHQDHELGTLGKREHVGVDGPIGRPDAISGYDQTRTGVYGAKPLNDLDVDNRVIEPHTGLPMNVGRFGGGAGGTDGSKTIHGLEHGHGGVAGHEDVHPAHRTGAGVVGGEAGHGVAQGHGHHRVEPVPMAHLEEIKKGDTIY